MCSVTSSHTKSTSAKTTVNLEETSGIQSENETISSQDSNGTTPTGPQDHIDDENMDMDDLIEDFSNESKGSLKFDKYASEQTPDLGNEDGSNEPGTDKGEGSSMGDISTDRFNYGVGEF